ncbi:alpha/beta hydrolase [Achromobacter seleniivolatilans]|uniref:Alpha/beta hydrolase n=1 Tax=Achromobacter seleniivolatilans TaxID=3047478 RepID=A0ABY9M3I5_9BURK|nr:alpha/beta hydrolase [Achromobacter sp. R39]WMD21515.1 alpha/beta hydrolase [Achromobacter sp. R39]
MRSVLELGALACLIVLSLAACSPLTVLNGAVPDHASRVVSGVPYGQDARQQMDIYAPPGVEKPPVVVFFYGGSWQSGSRADYKFVGDALASRGIMAVIADYRLYPQVSYPDFVEDSARAVAWALHHIAEYGGDPGRVFVAGHSAGGYNAAMVALDARWLARFDASPAMLRGWIGMAGPYDFLPIVARSLKPVFHFPDTPPDSQPIAHVSANAPPALLMVGLADTTVDPARNTEGLAAALQAAHVPVTVVRYDRLGHALLAGALARPLRWRAPVLDDLAGFVLDRPASVRNQQAPVAAGQGRQ